MIFHVEFYHLVLSLHPCEWLHTNNLFNAV
jgi:hypothetical protein